MAIRDIVTVPDPLLKQVSKPVETVNDDTRALITDMFDSMYAAKGIGLAAIQIGVPLRVIVMDLEWGREDAPDHRAPRAFINPVITPLTDELSPYEEGCLSVPEVYDEIKRPARVRVDFLDMDGNPVSEEASGMFATCIQHEMDHLAGVLFIDHLSRLKRERAIARVRKVKRVA
jgi:peptide deformylase